MQLRALSSGIFALAMLVACHPSGVHHAPPGAQTSMSLQGDPKYWKESPHIHQFYETTRAAFAGGPDAVDVDAYEARSKEIFAEFADAVGAGREEMLDHLKDIPRQVVGIVRENPAILDSYDAFWIALSGPD